MDTASYLKSQGWLGHGYSLDARTEYKQKGRRGLAYDPQSHLDSTSDEKYGARGLVKPLLISQKRNGFGVGKKAHEPPSGNEWWLKGFAAALGNFGKTGSERDTSDGSGWSTPVGGRPEYTGKHAGLYKYFVGGGLMEGTIEEKERKQKTADGGVYENSRDRSDSKTSDIKNERKRKRDRERGESSTKRSKRTLLIPVTHERGVGDGGSGSVSPSSPALTDPQIKYERNGRKKGKRKTQASTQSDFEVEYTKLDKRKTRSDKDRKTSRLSSTSTAAAQNTDKDTATLSPTTESNSNINSTSKSKSQTRKSTGKDSLTAPLTRAAGAAKIQPKKKKRRKEVENDDDDRDGDGDADDYDRDLAALVEEELARLSRMP